jgi:hypothetical protein
LPKNKKPEYFYSGFVVPPVPRLRENQGCMDYFLDKMSSRIEGFLIIFSIKILLFIFLINLSRKIASSLLEQLKRRVKSLSLAIFVNDPE